MNLAPRTLLTVLVFAIAGYLFVYPIMLLLKAFFWYTIALVAAILASLLR